ncbi:MAG TPA: hypothetical protein VMV42_00200 [archaeon]|nr:hypothetical protein [archaeon]
MIFGNEFHMLKQEGYLAQSALLTGIEALRKTDHDQPGNLYSALFQLSTGFERLMKIALIVHHKGLNNLINPKGNTLRNEMRHDLLKLYQTCKAYATELGIEQSKWAERDSIEWDFVKELSNFARGARYFNLDSFSENKSAMNIDPLINWNKLHLRIANAYINGARQVKLNASAVSHCDNFKLYGFERSATGDFITQVDATFIHALLIEANPYLVWTVIKILRPFNQLLSRLTGIVRRLEEEKQMDAYTIPDMDEFFPMCFCDFRTATRRKRWASIYSP